MPIVGIGELSERVFPNLLKNFAIRLEIRNNSIL